MDCEGCEYSLYADTVANNPLFFATVDQFALEVHLPRSGIRILVSQPAPERTRIPLYSPVFRCIPYSYSSCSRGALNTLHNTVFPPSCRRIQHVGPPLSQVGARQCDVPGVRPPACTATPLRSLPAVWLLRPRRMRLFTEDDA